MVVVTTDYIPGQKLEMMGLVCGSMIMTVNAFKDIGSSFKTLFGGELKNYNAMMEKSRDEAINRMVQQAAGMGADAVINVRFSSSSIMQSAAEIMAYGTAVRFVY